MALYNYVCNNVKRQFLAIFINRISSKFDLVQLDLDLSSQPLRFVSGYELVSIALPAYLFLIPSN